MAFDPTQYVDKPVDPNEQMPSATPAPTGAPTGGFDPDAYLASPVQQEPAPENKPLSAGDVGAGGLEVATHLASEYGKPALEVGGALLGAKKTFDAINAYKANTNVNQFSGMLDAYNKMTHNIRQYEKMGQAVPAELRTAQSALGNQIQMAQSKIPGYTAGPTPPAPAPAPAGMPRASVTMNAPIPPATSVPQAQQQAGNFLNTISQKYGQVAQRVGPVLQKAAPMLEGAGKMLTPALIAKELFYTSPEERAILQRAEAERRAQGWKPMNER